MGYQASMLPSVAQIIRITSTNASRGCNPDSLDLWGLANGFHLRRSPNSFPVQKPKSSDFYLIIWATLWFSNIYLYTIWCVCVIFIYLQSTKALLRIKEPMCGSSNENSPNTLLCLNAWPLVDRTVWKGFGCVALLEEVFHRGWAVRFQKPMPGPALSHSVSVSLPLSTCWLGIRM